MSGNGTRNGVEFTKEVAIPETRVQPRNHSVREPSTSIRISFDDFDTPKVHLRSSNGHSVVYRLEDFINGISGVVSSANKDAGGDSRSVSEAQPVDIAGIVAFFKKMLRRAIGDIRLELHHENKDYSASIVAGIENSLYKKFGEMSEYERLELTDIVRGCRRK